jgi:hypothetical protein
MGRVVVDTSHAGSAFLYSAAGVSIMIDGGELRANWGPTSVDLPPGQHFIEVSSRYLGRTGTAGTWVPVTAGQTTMVYYRAPAWTFMSGSIGPAPQPTRGMTGVIVLIAVLAVIGVVVPILIAAGR